MIYVPPYICCIRPLFCFQFSLLWDTASLCSIAIINCVFLLPAENKIIFIVCDEYYFMLKLVFEKPFVQMMIPLHCHFDVFWHHDIIYLIGSLTQTQSLACLIIANINSHFLVFHTIQSFHTRILSYILSKSFE